MAMLGAFPVAALFALLYRFPVPLAGYLSGLDAVGPSVIGVVVYGALGGFPLLGALGAIGGAIAYNGARPRQASRRLLFGIAAGADVLGVGTLAVLDKIIGPW